MLLQLVVAAVVSPAAPGGWGEEGGGLCRCGGVPGESAGGHWVRARRDLQLPSPSLDLQTLELGGLLIHLSFSGRSHVYMGSWPFVTLNSWCAALNLSLDSNRQGTGGR